MKKFILLIIFILFQCSKDQILDPDAVFLIFPTNQNNCSSSTIIDESRSQVDFSWSEALNTDQYEIVIENQSNKLQTKIISLKNNTSIILERGINYSWWVISKSNKSSITAKSLTWQFYLEGPSIVEHLPFSAVLLDPKNEEEINLNNENKYILKWSGNDLDDDIDFYSLYLGNSMGEMEILENNIKNQEIEIELLKQKTYYWKILTIDLKGNNSSSQIYSFQTK
jgi:hypothetical protein